MKKLIAILVVFALAMGAAFAETTVSGAVFGTVTLFGSDTSDDAEITGGAGMDRVRIEAAGGDDDGKFGAWIRLDKGNYGPGQANVWWKPIDQFRLLIGGNADGMYGKEGVTGWGFHQTPTDTGVAINGDNVWGGSHYTGQRWATGTEDKSYNYNFREIFYGGFGGDGLMLEIKPVEMFGINIVLPYFQKENEIADIFGSLIVQFDLNLDFGNIALTYTGPGNRTPKLVDTLTGQGDWEWDLSGATGIYKKGDKKVYDGYLDTDTMGKIFVYAGIPIGDSVALDVGLSMTLPGEKEDYPINVGAGVKVAITEQFGLKARLGAKIPMGDDKLTIVLADVLPYFAINDLMTVFVGIGIGILDYDAGEESAVGFHFNPYLQVGSEWGPKFLVGFKLVSGYADGSDSIYGGDNVVTWSVPLALQVSF